LKPNIIVVFTDQQRWDTLGCYGQSLGVSPHLDQMAEHGVIFTNAFTCQPVCGPARSIMQTGLYASETGCFRNGIALHPRHKTVAQYLSEEGYKVGYIGKWHLASDDLFFREKIADKRVYRKRAIPPILRGGYKDYWVASDVLEHTSTPFEGHLFNGQMEKVEFKGYRVDELTKFALGFLEQSKESQPFFLFLSYLEPHQQNNFPNDHHFVGPEGSKEKFKDFQVPGDLEGKEGNWRENYAEYLGCCHSIDQNVKRIEKKLKELGLTENTYIIYMSDHGCHFRTRNKEYKRSCHESSIHIPLILKGPLFQESQRLSELVSTVDIPATILDLAGIPIPENFRGNSLAKLYQGRSESWKEEIFIQISESQVGRALRTDKWKYSVKAPYRLGVFHKNSALYMEEFLYDLEKDPYERHNLVKDPSHASLRKELAQTLRAKIHEIEGIEATIIPWTPRWKRIRYFLNFFRKIE